MATQTHTLSASKNHHLPSTIGTATFRDTWAGNVAARVVPFKTARRGERVIRYRWQAENGMSVGGFGSPFVTVAQAVRAAQRHALFSNVTEG